MPRLTRQQKEQIEKLLSDDHSPTEIARELKIARSSVYRIAKTQKQEEESEASSESQEEDNESEGSEASEDTVGRFRNISSIFASDIGLEEPSGDDDGIDDAPVSAPSKRQQKTEGDTQQVMGQIMSAINGSESRQSVELPTMENLRRPMPRQVEFIDPDFDRGECIQRIMFNVEHFAPLIRKIIGENPDVFIQSLSSRSDKELEGLLGVIDRTRSVTNMATSMKHTFYMVAQGTEIVSTQLLGMKTQGFVRALQAQHSEIEMAIKELAIENYNKFNKMNRPEMRLGMLAVMTLVQVDSSNRLREAMETPKTESTKPETEEKYADL